jgi:hypothetical protein
MIILLNEDQDENCEKVLYKELLNIALDNSIEIITSILDFININTGKFI